MMNRRALLAAIAGASLDPERLLWRPKLISIPRPLYLDTYASTIDVHEYWHLETDGLWYRSLLVRGRLISTTRWPNAFPLPYLKSKTAPSLIKETQGRDCL